MIHSVSGITGGSRRREEALGNCAVWLDTRQLTTLYMEWQTRPFKTVHNLCRVQYCSVKVYISSCLTCKWVDKKRYRIFKKNCGTM